MGVDKVKGRSGFAAFRSARVRVNNGPVRIVFVGNDDYVGPAVAYAINRKVGGAVTRNLIRRRLRSIVDELAPIMSAGAYLISVKPEVAALSYQELKANVSAVITDVSQGKSR